MEPELLAMLKPKQQRDVELLQSRRDTIPTTRQYVLALFRELAEARRDGSCDHGVPFAQECAECDAVQTRMIEAIRPAVRKGALGEALARAERAEAERDDLRDGLRQRDLRIGALRKERDELQRRAGRLRSELTKLRSKEGGP